MSGVRSADMLRFIHISDTHFGASDPEAIRALGFEIETSSAAAVVLTGDITQSGRRREFQAAERFLSRLPMPKLVVPGNHDAPVYSIAERLIDPWRRFRRYIARELNPVLSIGRLYVVGLNSARRAQIGLDWSLGALSGRQRKAAGERLASVQNGALKAVAFHHPVLPGPGRAGAAIIPEADEILEGFAQAGADLILTGHAHIGDAKLYVGGRRSIIVSSAGTASSTRIRGEAPSFNVVDWRPERIAVSVYRYKSGAFLRDARHEFSCERGFWKREATA